MQAYAVEPASSARVHRPAATQAKSGVAKVRGRYPNITPPRLTLMMMMMMLRLACCNYGETCCGSNCCGAGFTCSNGSCVAPVSPSYPSRKSDTERFPLIGWIHHSRTHHPLLHHLHRIPRGNRCLHRRSTHHHHVSSTLPPLLHIIKPILTPHPTRKVPAPPAQRHAAAAEMETAIATPTSNTNTTDPQRAQSEAQSAAPSARSPRHSQRWRPGSTERRTKRRPRLRPLSLLRPSLWKSPLPSLPHHPRVLRRRSRRRIRRRMRIRGLSGLSRALLGLRGMGMRILRGCGCDS
jgi:hypothetical protein